MKDYGSLMGYYKIDEKMTAHGKFELWENNICGEDVPAVVTLNNIRVGKTWDDLSTYIHDNY